MRIDCLEMRNRLLDEVLCQPVLLTPAYRQALRSLHPSPLGWSLSKLTAFASTSLLSTCSCDLHIDSFLPRRVQFCGIYEPSMDEQRSLFLPAENGPKLSERARPPLALEFLLSSRSLLKLSSA